VTLKKLAGTAAVVVVLGVAGPGSARAGPATDPHGDHCDHHAQHTDHHAQHTEHHDHDGHDGVIVVYG
jgi:hypothetical protein